MLRLYCLDMGVRISLEKIGVPVLFCSADMANSL